MHKKNIFETKKINTRSSLGFTQAFFTDRKRCVNLLSTIKNLPTKTAVIFREYDLPSPEREELAKNILKICKEKKCKMLVGKNLEMAVKLRADGVHFSDNDSGKNYPTKIPQRKILQHFARRKNFIFSLACHSLQSVAKADILRPDVIFLSPIFATKSHENQKGIGLQNLRKAARMAHQPVFALGGLNKKNLQLVQKVGASGFGAIEAFLNHE